MDSKKRCRTRVSDNTGEHMKMKIVSAYCATLFITFCLTFLPSLSIISNPINTIKDLLTKENLSVLREKDESSYYQSTEYQKHSYLDPAYKDLLLPSNMAIKVQDDIHTMLPRIVNVNPQLLENVLNETEVTINGQKLIRKDTTMVLIHKNKPINVGITIKHIVSSIGGTTNTIWLKILDLLPIHINCAFPIKNQGQEISLTDLICQQKELLQLFYEQSRSFSVTNIISFAKKYFDWSNIGLALKFTFPTVIDDEIIEIGTNI
jgi:hypothetical protein